MKATTKAGILAAAGLLLVIATSASAAVRLPAATAPGFPAPPPPHFVPLDEPTYPVRVTWAGAGQLWGYTVNNVGLLGLYEVTAGWPGYDGTWPDDVTNWNAFCCEWPAGSRQYYSFSTGMWIGGLVPQVVGADTAYVPIVASGSYDPDFTPMSPLWASNQYIEPAEDGNLLFVQPAEDRGQGQIEWGNADDFSRYLYYPQADTAAINPRRRAHFGTSDYDLKPTDVVSQMDTYCAMGDYVAEEDGYFLYPSYGYNTEPMGVRVEQRTYSWGYGPAANYIYVNCEITNMNTFAIDSLYVGYFMDNDVGPGDLDVQGVGPNDDLIGFDRSLNLGYTYDSNFNEPGWSTSAGYIGVVFCESPLGLTAFSTWTRDGPEGDVDYENRDDLKYAQLRGTDIPDDPDPRIFETFDEPQDVRHLSSSGPILSFEPGETVSVTLAVVMGASLDELRSNAERAVQQFEMGYLGTAPPPPPVLVATPQDRRVYLSWDNSPESAVDLITGEADFEGYRVYRSPTGVEGTWELLADYDVMGSQTAKAVTVSYQVGGSELEFGFEGFWGTGQDTLAFVGNDYSLEFYTDSAFTVFNTDQQSLYEYEPGARDVFTGDFCVVDAEDDEMVYDQPDPGNPFLGPWVDGARIYIDGFYIRISSGTPDPQDPPDMAYEPRAGDVFVVRTYNWAEVGDQTGLYYSYLDDDVINGISYYYAVTSYDRGSPANGIEPLESSVSQVRVRVVPRSRAADKQDPDASVASFAGLGTGEIYVEPAQPGELTGHTYRVECLVQGAEDPAWAWLLRDVTAGTVVSDTMAIVRWDFDDTSQVRTIRYPEDLADVALWDGMLVGLKAPKAVRVEEVEWTDTNPVSWVPEATSWNQHAERLEPYDYAMTFPPEGGTDVEGDPLPWRMLNLTLGVDAKTYLRHGAGGDPNAWDSRDWVFVLPQDAESFDIGDVVIQFKMNMEDTTNPAGPSDTLCIRTIRPLYPGDYYEIRTADYLATKGSYSMDDVNVVPNPYYVRAMWDENEYNRWVSFTHLPSTCTIRIFTVSGLLIRTLEHATDTDDGTEQWDLRTQTNAHCTSGLYVYQVEDERTGKTKVGKFAIVR